MSKPDTPGSVPVAVEKTKLASLPIHAGVAQHLHIEVHDFIVQPCFLQQVLGEVLSSKFQIGTCMHSNDAGRVFGRALGLWMSCWQFTLRHVKQILQKSLLGFTQLFSFSGNSLPQFVLVACVLALRRGLAIH